MRVVVGKALALVFAVLAAPVLAQDESTEYSDTVGSSHFSAMVYGVRQDDERSINDDEGLGARFLYGSALNSEGWFLEGQFAIDALETGIGGATDYYQYHLGVDIAHRWGQPGGFNPFILVGLGAVKDDVYPLAPGFPQEDDTSVFFNAGLGFVSRELGAGYRIRAEARYVASDYYDGFADWHYGVGIEVPIGGRKIVTKTVYKERIKEVAVEVPAPVQPPADSDADGVVDGVDRCPNTLAGAKVDQHGCVVKEQTINLEGIFFEVNSSKLKPQSVVALDKIAQFLKDQAELKVEIAGHTDSSGAAAYNQRLSQERADSVRMHLIRAGVDPARLFARGYGENEPIASNADAAGRALNRRVEFRISR